MNRTRRRQLARTFVIGTVALGGLAWWSAHVAPAQASELQFDETVITGDVLKPEVTVVITRENLNKSYNLELEESFLQKIVESVEEAPF